MRKKRCVIGSSCGMTCISQAKICRVTYGYEISKNLDSAAVIRQKSSSAESFIRALKDVDSDGAQSKDLDTVMKATLTKGGLDKWEGAKKEISDKETSIKDAIKRHESMAKKSKAYNLYSKFAFGQHNDFNGYNSEFNKKINGFDGEDGLKDMVMAITNRGGRRLSLAEEQFLQGVFNVSKEDLYDNQEAISLKKRVDERTLKDLNDKIVEQASISKELKSLHRDIEDIKTRFYVDIDRSNDLGRSEFIRNKVRPELRAKGLREGKATTPGDAVVQGLANNRTPMMSANIKDIIEDQSNKYFEQFDKLRELTGGPPVGFLGNEKDISRVYGSQRNGIIRAGDSILELKPEVKDRTAASIDGSIYSPANALAAPDNKVINSNATEARDVYGTAVIDNPAFFAWNGAGAQLSEADINKVHVPVNVYAQLTSEQKNMLDEKGIDIRIIGPRV